MRANRLKELWADGKPVVAGWCSIPNAFTAELMAGMGWDTLVIDTQHGLIGYARCWPCCRRSRPHRSFP